MNAAAKTKNFEKNPAKGGMPGQREERQGHHQRQLGIGAVESVVIRQRDLAAAILFDGRNDAEDGEVGRRIPARRTRAKMHDCP